LQETKEVGNISCICKLRLREMNLKSSKAGLWWLMPVNPSYSGGRDQEDRDAKPAQANSSLDSISKNTHHKKGLAEWFKVKALSSSPSTPPKVLESQIRLFSLRGWLQ
jgi:hypothetical protein